MTREEAIKILQKLYEGCNKHKNTDLIKEAINMAIKAFKAQGTCEDAVSRQTLQKELALYPIDDVTSEDEAGYNRAINDVQKMVLHLPSAQPEPQSTCNNLVTDCISRQAAIDAMYKILHDYFWANDEELDAIIATLNDLPSAQPEVIKCKDCKYIDNDGVCQNSKGLAIQDDDDFCSHAERRTDG